VFDGIRVFSVFTAFFGSGVFCVYSRIREVIVLSRFGVSCGEK
jgi:hypothetical protein